MKLPLYTSVAFLLAILAGCEMSTAPRGVATDQNSFRMSVPTMVQMRQGDTQTININLDRGSLFKQDVRIEVSTTPGVKASPANATIKASEGPTAAIKLMADKNAPLGEYRVSVVGTPATGTPAQTEFRVRVDQP